MGTVTVSVRNPGLDETRWDEMLVAGLLGAECHTVDARCLAWLAWAGLVWKRHKRPQVTPQ